MKVREAQSVRSNPEPVDGAKAKSDHRIPESRAGYMELTGAKKDGDCSKVKITGGVSMELGCCDYFQPESKSTDKFSCGTCEYLKRE